MPVANEAQNYVVKILNCWNNLLRVVSSPLSPDHMKTRIKKTPKSSSSSTATESIINKGNTFSAS